MLDTTMDVIKSVLKSDASIDVSERSRLVSLLRRGPETVKPKVESVPAVPRLLRRAQVAERLGVSLRTVDNLAIAGSIRRIKFPGRSRSAGFLEADVLALMEIRHEDETLKREAV